MLRFSTAGESHGEALIANLSGLPAGLAVDLGFVDRELWRRQQGFGRGGRMKIERDRAHVLSGVRSGITIGSPIAIMIHNADWENWKEALPVEAGDPAKHKRVASPRPGHADLAGALKYNFPEARYILERASARESTARVAAGGFAKLFLRELGIEVLSHVIQVGEVSITNADVAFEKIRELAVKEEVLLSCVEPETEQRMKEQVDIALRTKDTVGGVFEVVAHNVPPGLGTYAQWDERLDTRLAAAVMSLQAVKGVEIGDGVRAARTFGSKIHDAIGYAKAEGAARAGHQTSDVRRQTEPRSEWAGFTRPSNHAGGLEGGISNGKDIIVRGYLKPISTLRRPLPSVDFATREEVQAAYERSDVCVVPAAGVAAEAMVAITLAGAALEKFGGDSMTETRRNFEGYCEQLRNY